MSLYKPPTKVTTKPIPYVALVAAIDPTWNRFKHYEIQYEEFTGRNFYANPYTTGPYSGTSDNPVLIDGPYNVNE